MIIVSQNKDVIVNMDNIDSIINTDGEIQFFNGGTDSKGILGNYYNTETAKKVLKEIVNAYRETKIDEVYKDETRTYRPVYYMPQVEEV